MAVAGSSASPRPRSATKTLTPVTASLARQPLLRLAQLGPIAVRVAGQTEQLLVVIACLLGVAGRLGRLGRAIEPAQSIRGVLERRLVFLERRDRKSTRLNSSHLVISYAV